MNPTARVTGDAALSSCSVRSLGRSVLSDWIGFYTLKLDMPDAPRARIENRVDFVSTTNIASTEYADGRSIRVRLVLAHAKSKSIGPS